MYVSPGFSGYSGICIVLAACFQQTPWASRVPDWTISAASTTVDSLDHPGYLRRMALHRDDFVMLPGYHPYPRYGRVAQVEDGERVRVTDVYCGDPRCAAEHLHGDMI